MDNYPPQHEPHNDHGHDVSQAHFPIKTKPISLRRDMSSKVTLSSEHVDIKLSKLHNLFAKKEMAQFLEEYADEPVIIVAETFLEMTNLDDAPDDTTHQLWGAIGVALGIGVGIFAATLFVDSLPMHYFVIALLASVAGASGLFCYFGWQTRDLQATWGELTGAAIEELPVVDTVDSENDESVQSVQITDIRK